MSAFNVGAASVGTYGLAAGWELDRTLAFAAEQAAQVLTWRGVYPEGDRTTDHKTVGG